MRVRAMVSRSERLALIAKLRASLYSAQALASLPSCSWQSAACKMVPPAGSSWWLCTNLGQAAA